MQFRTISGKSAALFLRAEEFFSGGLIGEEARRNGPGNASQSFSTA
jgi:hypothetical protein